MKFDSCWNITVIDGLFLQTMIETDIDLTFQIVDLTKLNQHKEVSYNPAEVTVRALNYFLTDVINIIFSSTDAAAYYRAVAQ